MSTLSNLYCIYAIHEELHIYSHCNSSQHCGYELGFMASYWGMQHI
uniref:Uncharacterized protein n=1 Tax=Anguilla anguilla TaxID=7936 RepID=A0A0E9SHV6_ANGAN